MRILIVDDGEQRGTLAAVRALAAAGHEVGVADPINGHGARSRHCQRWYKIPEPGTADLIERVERVIRSGSYQLVFAGTDEYLLALSPRRDELTAEFPYPSESVLHTATDKLKMTNKVKAAGLSVPLTGTDPDRIPRFPAIIKESLHSGLQQKGSFEPQVASDAASARRLFERLRQDGRRPLWQEYLDGLLMAVVVLCDRSGEVIFSSHQSSSHTFPSGLGGSTRSQIVHSDHALEEKVASLMADLGWWGLAQIQFVLPDDGTPRLIDLNGRFYGSLSLVIDAGANLPAAWVDLVRGQSPLRLGPARVGVRYHWLEGDLRRASAGDRRGLAAEVAGCLRYALRAHHSIWRRDDPLPAVRFVALLLRRWLRKLLWPS